MRIHDEKAYHVLTEQDVIGEILEVRGKEVLELGCGRAWMTRLLAEQFAPSRIVATEVDRIQQEKNFCIRDLPNVTFRYGGAEAIGDPDGTYDCVFLFKSFHHVPVPLMGPALREIRRVLRPGGLAYFSEPVYWGPFNDILKLFHDERVVREAAFSALRAGVQRGEWDLDAEVFFEVPGCYATWDVFEEHFLRVTHTPIAIDDALYARVRAAFMAHMTADGAHFQKPHRVDLLRKPMEP